ncbi:MAG: hypothetical protein GY737_29435 [Desulfobacteraceae bacterium]|nr:hypothetical protein [Desulfobacteraceae bacterium]
MNKNNNNEVQFRIGGLLKLKTVGDYLKLVDKKVKLIFKEKDPVLNTGKIADADVADLSETGTHLVLKNVHIKRFFFFSKHIEKYNVPINNISTIQILDKHGKTD